MQRVLLKKLVATLLGLVLFITILLCAIPVQTANADSVIWEKVDYEKYFTNENVEGVKFIGGNIASISYLRQFKYLYVFLTGAGGMGGESANGKPGYGGGSGAFIIAKINLTEAKDFIIEVGIGGGKFEYSENDEQENGDGMPSSIWVFRAGTEQKPFAMDVAVCAGGKHGTSSAPGQGAIGITDEPKNNLMEIVYIQDGVDGGQASQSFSVDLGFKTEYFIYRPTGANPSGKGGGASVYHRGGDGGVVLQNGSNGLRGAGGGGAGRDANQGGYGGDAYLEIYGSNM